MDNLISLLSFIVKLKGKGFNPWHVVHAFDQEDRRMKSSQNHFLLYLNCS